MVFKNSLLTAFSSFLEFTMVFKYSTHLLYGYL